MLIICNVLVWSALLWQKAGAWLRVGASPRGTPLALHCVSTTPTDSLVFAGVKFESPVSTSLRGMGIASPSPIQQASLVALTTGLSCILHAETGSGKTLTYLLPILKRIYSSSNSGGGGIQAMIVVPTKELAVQVAADVASLVSAGSAVSEAHTRAVHLCLSSSKTGLDGITAPIVVGTPFKLVDAVLASSPATLAPLSYLVLDEVDRLVNALGKYSTSEERRATRDNEKPVEDLLGILGKLRGVLGAGDGGVQVVAASATVGRALRRELYRLLQGGGARSSGSKENAGMQGELPVIRPGGGSEDGAEPEGQSGGFTRKVGIPTSITHRCVLVQDASSELSTKLAAAKKMWTAALGAAPSSAAGGAAGTGARQPERGLLFVPQSADLQQVLGMLSYWGVKEATNLQRALGIEALRPVSRYLGQKRYRRAGEPKPREGDRRSERDADGDEEGREEEEDAGQGAAGVKKFTSAEMVMLAASNKIGSAARAESSLRTGTKVAVPTVLPDNTSEPASGRQLFVVPVSGTRGLHIQDVEVIYILQPPRTMDEYLHMAGRTGRQGNARPGLVVSLVNYDEMLRLQSWQTALGITFEVAYEK